MKIAPLNPNQTGSMVELLAELFVYYNPTDIASRAESEAHLTKRLLPDSSGLELIVASQKDGTIVGFAAIGFVDSVVDPRPEKSKQCFLKELYVKQAARGSGIGLSLMQWIADYAIEQGCVRIDWPVKSDNSGGIKFYESLGATRVEDRLSYRISDQALSSLAMQNSDT